MNPLNNYLHTGRYSGYSGKKAYSSFRMQSESDYNSIFNQNNSNNTDKTDKVDKPEKEETEQTIKLSKKAQSALDALVVKYGESVSFIAKDFKNEEEAKKILSAASDEFSVLITPGELEKMADDKGYMKEKLDAIDNAMRMSEQINAQFGSDGADKDAFVKSDLSKIGVSFDSSGKMTLFAELERTERAENENTSEKTRTYESVNDKKSYAVKKKYTVTAHSTEEMLEKLKAFSWNDIESEPENEAETKAVWSFDA